MTTTPAEPPTTVTFTPIFWDGVLPTAASKIAQIFSNSTKEMQVQKCAEMATFLASDEPDIASLNLDTSHVPFLIAIPGNTRKVRVVFGVGTGFGLNGIGPNPIQSNVLALAGEYEAGVSFPQVLVLPRDTVDPSKHYIPTDREFEEERKKLLPGDALNNKSTWFKYSSLNKEADLPYAVPIPAYLVYDGFNNDIDAVIVYERVKAMTTNLLPDPCKTFLLSFLKATLVKSKVDQNNVKQADTIFYDRPPPLANKWKRNRIAQLFPALTTPAQAATGDNATATATGTSALDADLIANIIRATRLELTRGATQAAASEEKKEEEDPTADNTLGLSSSAFDRLLIMCGVPLGCPEEIPEIWTKLSEKNSTKADKESEVRKALATVIRWKDAKVKPLSTIITMVAKRQFEGELSLSTLASATKGLTPFAVPCMSEAEIEAHNEHHSALATATTTTVTEVKATKVKASSPTSMAGLLKMIKHFGNLLMATFSEDSPLFVELDGLVEDLENYEETAQANFSRESIASVLWILHLQSRHFAAGLMTGSQSLLAEFQNMRNSVRMKLPVQHGDVPKELYSPPPFWQRQERACRR